MAWPSLTEALHDGGTKFLKKRLNKVLERFRRRKSWERISLVKADGFLNFFVLHIFRDAFAAVLRKQVCELVPNARPNKQVMVLLRQIGH